MVSQEIRDAALRYSETKCFMRDGQKYEIKVNISFDDDCNNKSFDFSVTGEIVRITKNGHRINDMCGCIHDEILRYFPKFASFVEMHCRNREGMPMYPFANGFYHLTKGNTKAVMEDWWITEEDGEKAVRLFKAVDQEEFIYLLYKLGFTERAKVKAELAIQELENLTGKTWVNPYTPEEECLYKMPEGLFEKKIEQRLSEGYYTEEAIAQRAAEEKERKFNEARQKIIEEARTKTEKVRVKRDIMLFILDAGLPIDNVIYYDHVKRVVFNWQDASYRSHITWEDLDKLMAKSDAKYHIPAYTVFTLEEAYKQKIDRGMVIMGDGFESCWTGEPLPYPHNSHSPKRQIHQDKK